MVVEEGRARVSTRLHFYSPPVVLSKKRASVASREEKRLMWPSADPGGDAVQPRPRDSKQTVTPALITSSGSDHPQYGK